MGSASELGYQLIHSHDLNYITKEKYESLTNELTQIKRMLNAFLKKLRANR